MMPSIVLTGEVEDMTYEELAVQWHTCDRIPCHTSGSTGKPKEILLTKTEMLNSAQRTVEYFGINEKDLLYSCISPDYIGGKMMFVRQQYVGCEFQWEEPTNRPLEKYEGKAISLLSVVPSQMIYILDNLATMPEIRNILVGGSAIPASLRKRISDSGVNAFESYGMTETSSHIALRKIGISPAPFRTLGNITVEEDNGALRIHMPDGQTILTNDAAEILSPTEFHIHGRLDNMIISGGKKINPEIVEEKLSAKLDFPYFITSLPDEKWGERLVIVAQTDNNNLGFIREACNSIEDGFLRPKQIIIKEKLSLTQNGKIIRKI